MKPILYNGNETDFTGNGIAVLAEALSCEVREVRNGEFELTLEYPVDGPWFKEIIEQRIVRAKPNDKDDLHNFRIYNVTKDSSGESVVAQAATLSNDLGGNLVKYLRVDNLNAQAALNAMKLNLVEETKYNFISDITTLASTTWEMRNPLNCIVGEDGSLVDMWGGEVKRTDTTIYLYSRRGLDKVTRIRPRKGMTGFSMKSSIASVVTRVQPYAVYQDEKTDKEVTLIGTIVESPRKGNYAFSKILPVQYTENADGTPITTTAQLNAVAKNYFSENPNIDKPKVEITADLIALADTTFYDKFKKLETIGLTDTIEVYVPKYDIDVELKITELVYNVLTEQVISLKAGDTSSTFYQSNKYEYGYEVNQLKKYIYTVENGLRNYVQISADGKNTIFRGYTEPDKSISHEGDLWFKEVGNGEQEIWIFDGSYWQPIVTAGINEELAAKLAEAQEAIDAAEKNLSDAQAELANVSQATTAAQAAADQALAAGNDAKAKVEQAQQDIANLDSKVEDVTIDVGSALQNAAAAQQKATDALTNATSAMNKASAVEETTQELQVSIDGFTSRMTSIETSNQQTVQKLNEVTATVDGMTQTLATVETTANSALSKTNTLSNDVDSMKITLASVETNISNQATSDRNLFLDSNVPTSNESYLIRGFVMSEFMVEGEDYVFRAKMTLGEGKTWAGIWIDGGTIRLVGQLTKDTDGTYYAKFKGRKGINTSRNIINIYVGEGSVNGVTSSIEWAKLTKSNVVFKDWTPAPEDLATISKVNQIESTVNGTVQTVASVKTTADSALTKATQVETTANGLKTTISNVETTASNALTKATQVETTANGLTSTVSQLESDLNGLEIGGRNYYRQGNSVTVTDPDVKFERTAETPNGFKLTGAQDRSGTVRINNVIKSNGYWTVSFDLRGSQSVTSYFNLDICDLNNTDFAVTADNNWRRVSLTVNVTNYTPEVYNFVDFQNIAWAYFFIKDFKVEKGNKATGWTPAPEDMATTSQITQLSNEIDLRVKADGVINAINISPAGTVIYGNKLTITAETRIDNGIIKTAHIADLNVTNAKIANLAVSNAKIADLAVTNAKIADLAVTAAKIANATITNAEIASATILGANIANATITDAKIGSLSATKITTGTLNAANVNIINLNANSITTGTISGTNLSINLASGEVIFNKGIIKNLDNTFQMNITTGVTASRGEYLSPNDTGNTLAAGYNLMNGKIEFYTGTFGETSVSYGGLTTETHSGQYKENGIWQAGMWSGSKPAIALKMANPNTSVWQSVHRAVLLSSTEYQEPFSSSFFTGATWLGYGDISGADTKQNIRGAGIGVKQSGSDVNKDEAGGLFSEAWVTARHGVYLASGYVYDSTINGRRYLAPTIRLGTTRVNSGASASIKEMASTTTITAGYKISMQSKYIELWAGDSGEINLNAHRTDINGGGNASSYGGMSFGRDSKGRVWSMAIYDRTYAAGNGDVCITTSGTLGRKTSARKYKADIKTAYEVIAHAKEFLTIKPASWYDKKEYVNGIAVNRFYGFIADEFHEKGLTEVVYYGDKGQVEGLAYDRLTMYQNVILSEHEREIQSLKQELEQLKIRVQELEAS